MTNTYTQTSTFTVTHARNLAAKVATDLKRMQRFYGYPNDKDISNYETEIVALLKAGYLGIASYGFKKDGDWIEPTLRYSAQQLSASTTDNDPGRIPPNADISGASFYSYLTYSTAWFDLSKEQKVEFKKALPFFRGGADEPGINGYISRDLTYSSGGKSLDRSIIRSY